MRVIIIQTGTLQTVNLIMTSENSTLVQNHTDDSIHVAESFFGE